MKVLLRSVVADEPVEVSLRRTDPAHADGFSAEVHDVAHVVGINRSTPAMGRIVSGGRTVPFRVLVEGARVAVWMDGSVYEFERVDRTARRVTGGAVAGVAELTAPMPGRVLRVEVASGDRFDAHAALVIMESMKMEMTLSSPQPGRVREVLCQEGELVEMGARLALLEPVEEEDAGSPP